MLTDVSQNYVNQQNNQYPKLVNTQRNRVNIYKIVIK